MAYTKPQVIAQNASSGSYAAGCPSNTRNLRSSTHDCVKCEITF